MRAARIGVRRAAVRAVGLDLLAAAVIATAVAYGLGALTGNEPLTPTLMMFTAPDVAVWIYAVIIFFAVRAVVRAISIGLSRRHAESSPLTGAR